MTTPNTVQRQLEAAEAELQRQQQAVQSIQGVVDDVSQLGAPAAPAPAAPAPAPAAPAPAPTQPNEDWQQRFRTLQGMFNAEVPQLRAQNKTFESQVTALQEQVRALTAAATKPVQPPAVDPRDGAQFGDDLVEMVQRYATRAMSDIQSQFGEYASRLEARVASLEQHITGVSEKTEVSLDAIFYDALTKSVPNWRQINESSRWLEWLNEEDDVYGVTRQAALNRAYADRNAGRVSTIFRKFIDATAATGPTLESQVTPSSSPSGQEPPTQPAAPKLISQKAVQTFYNDLARGRYQGREAEAERIRIEIDTAAAQGRIV